MAPAGVTAHFTRLPIHLDNSPAGTMQFYQELAHATHLVAQADVDAVLYNCTVGSILFPAEAIAARMRAVAGVPGVSTASALLAAFRRLGSRRIALVTPYDEALSRHEQEWLEANGYQVASLVFHGFGPGEFHKLKLLGPEDALSLTAQADRLEADTIFISCADFACAEAIVELERRHGKPVVTSNQASFWHAVRSAGYPTPIERFGRLLTLAD